MEYSQVKGGERKGISIITPLYNQNDVFWETFNSILDQSFKRWEWIIVNDGSNKAETIEILNQVVEKKDPRISVHHIAENKGLPTARNAGIKLTSCEYILFIDSDDLLERDYLEKAYLILELNPDFAFTNSWSSGFGHKNYVWRTGFEKKEKFLEKNLVAFCGLFRRECLLQFQFNEQQKDGLEDWEFWINLAANGHWGYTIPEVLFHYRTSPDSDNKWKNWDEGSNELQFRKYLKNKFRKSFKNGFPDPQFHNSEGGCISAFSSDKRLKQKPTIVVILPWLQLGGVEQFTIDWMKTLSVYYDFIVLTTHGSDHSLSDVFKNYCTDIFHLSNLAAPLQYPNLIKYIFESRKPDVLVLSHSEVAYSLLGWIRTCFPDLRVADINHVVEPHFKNGGYPRISAEHTAFIDSHVVTSKNLQQWMCGAGVEKAKSQVVYTGANIERDDLQDQGTYPVASKFISHELDVFNIVFSGRIVDQKNIPVLLMIAKKLSMRNRVYKLLICGDGPDREALEEMIYKQGLNDNVVVLGALSHVENQRLLKAADVLILPSKWEGIATVIYEAMSLGKAVIATNVGGQAELVAEEAGILLPIHNDGSKQADLFVEKIEMLMDNPSIKYNIGVMAKQRVKNYFDKAESHKQLHILFDKLIQSEWKTNSKLTIEEGLNRYKQYVNSTTLSSFLPYHLRGTPSPNFLRVKKVYKVLTGKRPLSTLWKRN